jgi:hypothetical protein
MNEDNFIDSLFSSNNPVETLLFSIFTLDLIHLFALIILIFSLISKYLLNTNLELSFIDKILPYPYNIKIKPLILKFLKYYSKNTNLTIILAIIVILISSLGSTYLFSILMNNFSIFCKVFLNKY